MTKDTRKELFGDCCSKRGKGRTAHSLSPRAPTPDNEKVCCGPPADPPSGPFERPGYRLLPFVEDFIQTAAGPVPKVKTYLDGGDRLGSLRVRWGVRRNQYKIAPGLYGIGRPDEHAPVLVTANYKLSFDTLRSQANLPGAWILVVDTCGINVWCAAGKGTFSTAEVVRSVRAVGLQQVVGHRRIILPQLAATGVSARHVQKGCGFAVVWGPVRAADLKRFLDAGRKASPAMRRVTFTLRERLALVPVELSFLPRYALWIAAAVFLLSGIGIGIFSVQAAWHRGLWMATAVAGGIFSGAVLSPALLPWIPARWFSVKGTLAGLPVGATIAWLLRSHTNGWEAAALVVGTVVLSSYMAMNFTGSTPYTSPSGVEKEMRRAIPVQAAALVTTVVLWMAAAFA